MRIVVVGASRGIGRAIAEHFRALGDEVWTLARNADGAFSSRCDVADWAQVAAARDAVAAHWDSVHAVICAAATQGEIGAAMSADPLRWSETVRVNLDGTFFVIRAFWELLQRAPRRGKIVCFSGGGATKARVNFSAYAASKTAVVRLVENLAAEWAGEAVDINAIAPGAINTDMTRETAARGPALAGRDEYEAACKQLEQGGQSLERALGLVQWLLSEKSDGISGRLLSAQWDAWENLADHRAELAGGDVFQLRRIIAKERSLEF
jgi:NAD(P)-dependent dehydrogenase (short-subunit alcohol dehydrogenase family)